MIERIVNWFLDTHSYKFFEGNGFALVLSCFVILVLLMLLISKKFRTFFYKKFF